MDNILSDNEQNNISAIKTTCISQFKFAVSNYF